MRQFIIDTEPDSKGLVYIEGKDFKYIRQVLRLCVGDMIKLSYRESVINATVCSIDDSKKKIILQVCDVKDSLAENKTVSSRPEFWLLQFIPKPQKMELIIRQAVEAGVSVIVPVIGEYTQKGAEKGLVQKSLSNEGKQNRISRIIKEARQQSGSPVETKVFEPLSLKDAVKIVNEHISKVKQKNKEIIQISLYERNEESKTVHEVVAEKMKLAEIGFGIIAVGSEGGISPAEIKVLKDAGFSTVHFDVNILRCETASLYGMASIQTVIMELPDYMGV